MTRALLVPAAIALSLQVVACTPRVERRVMPDPAPAPSEARAPIPAVTPVTPVSPAPSTPTSTSTSNDLSWLSSLRRAKSFTTHDVKASPLVFHWRMLRERRRPGAPPGEEYPALYVRAITLTVGTRTIALGDHSGSPESAALTHCRSLGYRQPPGETWSFPALPYLVASFSVATMQGSSDWLILDGGRGRLHVLGRHTHDGACPTSILQGPLEVCTDMTWERRFDLLLADADVSRAKERMTFVEDGGDVDFDCKQSYSGERLLPP